MPPNKVWTLESWAWERPEKPEPCDDLRQGLPSVRFVNGAGLTATLVFERDGRLREVRFSGPKLSSSALRYMGVGDLEKRSRKEVAEALRAIDAGRREGVDPDVLRRQEEARALREQTRHLRGLSPAADAQLDQQARGWALEDMVDGFRGPHRPGRAGGSDVDLAIAAVEYEKRCVKGGEKVGDVARSLSLTPSGFSGRVLRARAKGYLSGSPARGQVEGEAQPAAHRLIAKARSGAPKGG